MILVHAVLVQIEAGQHRLLEHGMKNANSRVTIDLSTMTLESKLS